MSTGSCFHCGLPASEAKDIVYDSHLFCCQGCKTIYSIFSENGLLSYYEMQKSPGAVPNAQSSTYAFLDNSAISDKLLDFREGNSAVITLHIPYIHCSSCIWILENLHRLNAGIKASQVNFPAKKVRVSFDADTISLRELAVLLASIGYEPNITLDDYGRNAKKGDTSLYIKLGVAFFGFGNIMLLSFPEYFGAGDFWLEQYKPFFRTLIFLLALPPFLYSASGYYTTAWKSLRTGFLSIEVPIALGIIVMFVRSTVDMFFNFGPGFFDSMCGLIFFMLLGKVFQSKTYQFLNFERDYKSYFPVAVTRIAADGTEENVPIHEIAENQKLLIRNHELIPCDGVLLSGNAEIDYSFVTGESVPVAKFAGNLIFAGGKYIGPGMEMSTTKKVSQSYLTQLWSDEVFAKGERSRLHTLTETLSKYFTPLLLLTAAGGFVYWFPVNMLTAFTVFTAVLIVACPCALALTAPFTLGNIIRIMGRHLFYLKNTTVIENMANADTIVFDKTGTLTTTAGSAITYEGKKMTALERQAIASLLRSSNHPLSRMLYEWLPAETIAVPENFVEIPSKGIQATFHGLDVRLGSLGFVSNGMETGQTGTSVHISFDDQYYGNFKLDNQYRDGLVGLFSDLANTYRLSILSGDNSGEEKLLRQMLPAGTHLVFNQSPHDKLNYIKTLQANGRKVIMIGDGLNDAGALAQSDVGIAISENVNVFSPACDAIMDASVLKGLSRFLRLSKKARLIIKLSFVLSLGYNAVGLWLALSGTLSPLAAAIIMPLSTVTIVSFVTVSGTIAARISGVSKKIKS